MAQLQKLSAVGKVMALLRQEANHCQQPHVPTAGIKNKTIFL